MTTIKPTHHKSASEIRRALRLLNVALAKTSTYHENIPCTLLANLVEEAGFYAEGFNGIYCGRTGEANISIGHGCYVKISWYKMESGRYEIISYAHK